MSRRIAVVGAGVVGLSTALRLRRSGFEVRVLARELPPHTTSNMAGAVWYPFLTSGPFDWSRSARWAEQTLRRLKGEFAEKPGTGVLRRSVLSVVSRSDSEPSWSNLVSGFRRATAEELAGCGSAGFVFDSVVIDPDRHLNWLQRQNEKAGVIFERGALCELEDACDLAPIVINCSGLGARQLCGDRNVVPARGQILLMQGSLPRLAIVGSGDDMGPLYAIPRCDDVALGGTKHVGDWDPNPRPAETHSILSRCESLWPGARTARLLSTRVGLRPCRHQVRLESESRGNGRYVIHNYGHGGSGFTLSWGCADEVCGLVRSLVEQ